MKWGSNLVTIILGIILLITMYAAVSTRLNGGNPKVFGLQWYEVLSGSMEPGIHTGSVILDKPNADTNQLKVGDVITFKAPDQEYGANETVITHRIQQVEHQNGQLLFQTKGDANDAPDPALVPAANVIAQYDNITIPYLGYYLNFVKTRLGIGLLVILPGVLLIASTMASLFRDIMKLQKPTKSEASSEAAADKAKF
ncbi:peptidase S26 [Alicyclobacillus ferrooxydans]|uniref:Signal peptidase I n=2 Tax=Alicyclobacillus ferrooxydans TaxID=471514 RepID=A0A0P9EU59_9BACL|nr:peptidase S26 [Alicyclobacillus ferrooxydans]